ncbi:MAG: LysM peptidoglycan-binding domain-containing protein, partial [Bacteroidales bacterium]|nr:LysM peptidoglycan-binding domain-containing protein [Bacteroidales bacterium]
MNYKVHLKLFLTIIVFLLFASADIFAQIVIERSKDKVIISGIQYYIHLVKKGETAYSISKTYNLTSEELYRENPSAAAGLKEGQLLKIPVREAAPESPLPGDQPSLPRNESAFHYHRIQPGQTVYSLSKLYDVTEKEILAANPGIDISRLPVYSEIAVPKRDAMGGREILPVQDIRTPQDARYMFHKVEAGESLASIAGKYGVTLRELRRENRNVKFPQVGDYLRIPESGRMKFQLAEIEQPAADTADAQPGDTIIVFEKPEGYTTVNNLNGTFNIAVLLPFYLAENAIRMEIDSSKYVKGKVTYRQVKKLEDWIYYRSAGFVEMYQGILLAVDTLRSLGLNINLHAFDIKSDTIEVTRLINRGQLAGMHLIIGPVYSRNLAIVSEYARKTNIPVVSPVRLMNNSALVNNPLLFMANASLAVAQDAIAKEASDYYLNNFIFIHADTARNDPDVIRFR